MKIGLEFDANGNYVSDFLEGMTLPEGHKLFAGEAPAGSFTYIPKLVNGVITEGKVFTMEERRQTVLLKWDPQIDAQRETLRKLQDEDKPAAAITKAKTNLHNLVASKNTELAGVV